MKKIALISSYCDTDEKKEVLESNLRKLKNLGLDTFVISPIKMEIDSDFFFITKENPILGPENKAISFWKNFDYRGKTLKLVEHVNDYGWASLYQIKKIMEISKNMDYNLFYFLIYDLIITEELEYEIIKTPSTILYPRRDALNKNIIYPYSLHFSIFDKMSLENFSKKISIEDYIANNGFAENFIEKWAKELNLINSDLVVDDSITNHSNPHKFNYSLSPYYNLFFSKNDEMQIWKGNPPSPEILSGNLRLYFYNLKKTCLVKIKINSENYDFYLNRDNLIHLEIPSKDVIKIEIDFDGEILEYSQIYTKIVKNLIHLE